MSDQPQRHLSNGRRTDDEFRLDVVIRPASGDYVIVVAGTVDPPDSELLQRAIENGLASNLRTVGHLDGVELFGSAAARVTRRVLDDAAKRGADLVVKGVPSVVQRVFDIVGLTDDRIHVPGDDIAMLSPVVFGAVMANGALHSREPVCITTHDVDDPLIVFVNDAFCDMTGYSSDQMVGASPKMLQGPLTERAVLDELKQRLRADDASLGEAVNYRADGTPFWMNWRIVPVHYGSHRYFMALQRDATELRQLHRFSSARTRVTRLLTADRPPSTPTEILESLARAASIVVENSDVAIATAVTDSDGDVTAANLEGSYLDRSAFADPAEQIFDRDGSATLHLTFDVDAASTGHLVITGLHPHWLHLLDVSHLEKLCEDSSLALRNANS